MTDIDLTQINAITDEIEELQNQMLQKSKEAFGGVTAGLFEAYPELESFGWVQYTPYFNDGDECVFGVRAEADYGISINGHEMEDLRYGYHNDPNPELADKLEPIAQALSKFIYAFDDSLMKKMFGDHVQVTVYPDRVETEGYDHD